MPIISNFPVRMPKEKAVARDNVEVALSFWSSSSAYADYPYEAVVHMTGVTSAYYPEVVFNESDTETYGLASFAESDTGVVKIFAKKMPDVVITIPSVICVLTDVSISDDSGGSGGDSDPATISFLLDNSYVTYTDPYGQLDFSPNAVFGMDGNGLGVPVVYWEDESTGTKQLIYDHDNYMENSEYFDSFTVIDNGVYWTYE